MSLNVNLGRMYQRAYMNLSGQSIELRQAALNNFIFAVENDAQPVLTQNKYTGTRIKISDQTIGTQEGTTAAGIMAYTREASGYQYIISLDTVAPPNYVYKLHFDSVANQANAIKQSSVRVYKPDGTYATISKADLLETYGNYLIFDYLKFSENTSATSKYGAIGPYLNDTIVTDSVSIGLKFTYQDATVCIPFCFGTQGNVNYDYAGSRLHTFSDKYMYNSSGGQYQLPAPTIYTTNITSLLYIYAAELQNIHGGNIDYDDATLHELEGEYIKACTDTGGNNPFWLIHKDVLDNFILDFYSLTGILLEYTGNIPTPSVNTAQLNTLEITPLTSITPTFNSDTYIYAARTPIKEDNQYTLHLIGNTYSTYVAYRIDGGEWQASLMTEMTAHITLNGLGTYVIDAIAQGPNAQAYTVTLVVYDPLQTAPGQDPNGTNNTGGNGTNIGDAIGYPSTPFGATGMGSITYLLDYVQFEKVLHSFYNPNIFTTLTDLTMNSVISVNLWPMVLGGQGVDVGGVIIGNTPISFTGLTGHTTTKQVQPNDVYRFDFGSLSISKDQYFGGFLDYEPYTSIQIYLPYCGIQTIKAHDVIGHTIHLLLTVDAFTGTGQYVLAVEYPNKNGGTSAAVKYKWPCMVAQPIKITGSNMATLQQALTQNAGQFIKGIASNPASLIGGTIGALHDTLSGQQQMASSQGDSLDRYEPQTPYLIVTRPNTVVPEDYNRNFGRPSLKTQTLQSLRGQGFTTVPNPLVDVNATEYEKNYIINALKEGVYL